MNDNQNDWQDVELFPVPRRQRSGGSSSTGSSGVRMSAQGYPVDEYGVRLDRPIYGQSRRGAYEPPDEPPDEPEPPRGGKGRNDKKKGARGHEKKKKAAGKRVLKVLAVLVALAVVVAAAGGIYLWSMLGRVQYDEETVPLDDSGVSHVYDPQAYNGTNVTDLPIMGNTDDVTNILLMGVDSASFEGRSDTNIILSVNSKTGTIKMASLMRDLWVTLPGLDEDNDGWDDESKLNAAYAYGGTPLHLKMIQQNFHLHIDQYIAVNFEAFPKVIDAMGGVDMELTGDEADRVPAAGSTIRYGGAGYVPMGETDGTYHMDGFQALQYSRIRYLYADADFSRTSNQRKLISALIQKAKGMNVLQLNDVLSEALPQVRTNMSRTTFMGYSINAFRYANYEVDSSYRVPQDGLWESDNKNGASVLVLTDPVRSIRELHQYLYG